MRSSAQAERAVRPVVAAEAPAQQARAASGVVWREGETMSAEQVARRFADAISRQDVEGICSLMTADHQFVDPGGQVVAGCEPMRDAWIAYFRMVPDYTIEVSEVYGRRDNVVLLGQASGTYTADGTLRPENHWVTPAAWKAVVRGDRIALWQVFADNEPMRIIMSREQAH